LYVILHLALTTCDIIECGIIIVGVTFETFQFYILICVLGLNCP